VVEVGKGMPPAVWERLEAQFPGVVPFDAPHDWLDTQPHPMHCEHRMMGAVSRALRLDRPRVEGVLVDARYLLPVLCFLRDELGYVYLANLTAVDYPEGRDLFPPHIDVVYHLFRLDGGGYVALHAHASRQDSVLPSITPEFPAANLQEREVWDMFGVRFDGHPDLRRLFMWEGFDGFPLRKDWREPYFEAEHKPYRSRFPDGGNPTYAEARLLPLASCLTGEASSTRDTASAADFSEADQRLYDHMLSVDPDEPLKTGETILQISLGHRSPCGVLRMAVRLNGETVQHLEPLLGYVHRNHEKIGERNTWLQNIPYTDRLDSTHGMTSNLAYCLAMERLLGWTAPERVEYIRVIMSEFSRILNHMLALGLYSAALGMSVTGPLYTREERKLVLDLFATASGGRTMFNYMRPGGIALDLPAGWIEQAKDLVRTRLPRRTLQMQEILLENEIIRARSQGVGVLTGAEAVAYGATGPVLRACGVPYDVRRADPYGIYDRLAFDVVTREAGDAYARMALRFDEIGQSLRILEQALDQIPGGAGEQVMQSHRLSPKMHLPRGETYGRIEAPKGELGFYLVSDGGANPYRYHIRVPSLGNLTPLSRLTRGVQLADVTAILSSIDLAMGEVDR
jgi:NADH-quinone oxidoreductase subunit C/D